MAPKKNTKTKVPIQPVPEKRGYEFCGPPGAFAFVTFLPALIYAFTFFCNDVSGCPAPSLLHPSTLSLDQLKKEVNWPQDGLKGFFDARVTLWVLSYYLLSLALNVFLPGDEVEGTELACTGRLRYKFNAFPTAVLILSGLALGTYVDGADFVVWTFLWDNYVQVITANLIICTAIAVFVYARSFSVPAPGQLNPELRQLAPGGHTGNALYDFFIGRELNPRVKLPIPFVSEASRTIDIKVWCEMRPGLLGWNILNLSNIARQYRTYGYVTDSIVLSTAFQLFYVLDGLYMEPAVLTTMDVIMDGFGFMLSFGDMVWVPFVYNFQTRYLAVYPLELGLQGILLILAVTGVGYSIFRGANNQKNRFRTDPNDPRVKHIKYIETASGSKLMISGWWGMARHINYLGDWLMSWSYSLPTGFAGYTIIESITQTGDVQKQVVQNPEVRGWGMIYTYFFLIYFGVLLIHRERRDEEKCKRKYGPDWNRYTSLVRSRIVPGIY
ncbi:delta(14)-sterol reductase [Aspergillus nomiae NRRL 13137]|uniref:Delta(14)-sterol reductase n=1 Tax=Aspergillus nomiae NRRL (strain ATCC 15546 / NRRL 13137 / CBS 260.88 / M93) TaxID=1509407 RepID=A0A0L1J474_ASPN3|nr:delta(14)-sterol reductase [Aspergillus nomiae NRRL 13137]KNG86611.1 delta(14)-sterol reductase [Aspergillus nomiae NRRL 13137]